MIMIEPHISDNFNIEHHPWNWYGVKDSRILIAGTFPPTKNNWSFDFFYPNKRNFFWKILAEITGRDLKYFKGQEAVDERRKILDHLKITITDMGSIITRKKNNSLDENLVAVAYMDIIKILNERMDIRKVIFTSSSGKVSAARWFQDYLSTQEILYKFPKGPKPVRSYIQLAGRMIELVILYSPSARAANRISFEKLTDLYRDEIVQ